MKKILVAVAIFAAMIGSASAQTKSVADVKKAVTAAEAAAENPKKSAKLATWTKLASAYLSAYDQPTGTLWIGASLVHAVAVVLVANGEHAAELS